MSENHYVCHCGGVILADTEDWEQPLCHYHYCEFLGNYQSKIKSLESQLESAKEIIDEFNKPLDKGVNLQNLRSKIKQWLKDSAR